MRTVCVVCLYYCETPLLFSDKILIIFLIIKKTVKLNNWFLNFALLLLSACFCSLIIIVILLYVFINIKICGFFPHQPSSLLITLAFSVIKFIQVTAVKVVTQTHNGLCQYC